MAQIRLSAIILDACTFARLLGLVGRPAMESRSAIIGRRRWCPELACAARHCDESAFVIDDGGGAFAMDVPLRIASVSLRT